MTDNQDIRGLINENFSYLITDYDFIEDKDIKTADIYSEVRFKKNDWRISIVTTSHGTKISMKLISPQGNAGFLDYYLNTLDNNHKKNESEARRLIDNIRYYSDFLNTRGHEILVTDPERLTTILTLIRAEHDKWIETFKPGT